MRFFSFFILSMLFVCSCSTYRHTVANRQWAGAAVIEELEVYVDTATVKYANGYTYAWVKTVYATETGREYHRNTIRNAYGARKDADKKASQWDDFAYNVSYRLYDCANKRYKILEITDFTSDDQEIITTRTREDKARWLDIESNTMGDHTLYYICDFGVR